MNALINKINKANKIEDVLSLANFKFLETPLPVSEFFINRSPKAGALEQVKFQKN